MKDNLHITYHAIVILLMLYQIYMSHLDRKKQHKYATNQYTTPRKIYRGITRV
jgi:hypothetical protein